MAWAHRQIRSLYTSSTINDNILESEAYHDICSHVTVHAILYELDCNDECHNSVKFPGMLMVFR